MQDGCFWMSFEQFCAVFNTVYVCRLLLPENGWKIERRHGEWTPESAGNALMCAAAAHVSHASACEQVAA